LVALSASALALIGTAQAVNVTTYHNDNMRTGWNSSETVLTPANVRATTFGLLETVAVDDFVDAQPLVVTNENIGGTLHNVVYVVSRNNTVYAIDGSSGRILLSRNLGKPVPGGTACAFANLGGILGTPTIDLGLQRIYLIAYVYINSQAHLQLHALSLSNLQDAVAPVNVTATHLLSNGTALVFNPNAERNRPALLEVNGNIYAGLGSFCPYDQPYPRGWLIGWNRSLVKIAGNEITITKASNMKNFFLGSIWMSGYGLAADALNNIYFVTGNSNPYQDTYDGTTSIQESAVKMPPNLSTVSDLFTPSNVFTLDQGDLDFGAGGLMVLPDQPGPVTHLAVSAGKDGRMFILDRDDMGGFHNQDVPAHVWIGRCWCGESYYKGADGIGRVVSSGGSLNSNGQTVGVAKTWKVNTSLPTALVFEAQSPNLAPTSPDPGFFTSISSNGTSNPIIFGRWVTPAAATIILLSMPSTARQRTVP
jgi:hypothetical protein